MTLALAGEDLLTYPEFNELMAGLQPHGPSNGVILAWWSGEPVSPQDLHRTLSVECRLQVRSPEADRILDGVISRIEAAHPELAP